MCLDALGLREIDVVALLHAAHGALARVLVRVAAQQVVEQAFAHGAIGHLHALDAELLEHLGEDGHTAGERQLPFIRDRVELEVADVLDLAELVDDALEPFRGDVERVGVELADAVADGAHGAGTADRLVPTTTAECGLVRLDGLARGHARIAACASATAGLRRRIPR